MAKQKTRRELEIEVATLRGQVDALERILAATRAQTPPFMPSVPGTVIPSPPSPPFPSDPTAPWGPGIYPGIGPHGGHCACWQCGGVRVVCAGGLMEGETIVTTLAGGAAALNAGCAGASPFGVFHLAGPANPASASS